MTSYVFESRANGNLSWKDSIRISFRQEPVLIAATQPGHTRVVKALLRAGSQVSITDSRGKTALHWAANRGNDQLVRTLLDFGAGKMLPMKICCGC